MTKLAVVFATSMFGGVGFVLGQVSMLPEVPWLYAFGAAPPSMRWGSDLDSKAGALVSWCGNTTRADEDRPRLGGRAAAATPDAFRDVLLSIARSAEP